MQLQLSARERRKWVDELLRLGFCFEEIMQALSCSSRSLRSDYEKLDGIGKSMQFAGRSFPLQLKRMAELYHLRYDAIKKNADLTNHDITLHLILFNQLKMNDYREFLNDVAVTFRHLVVPHVTEKEVPYVDLLWAVFGNQPEIWSSIPREMAVEDFFRRFMKGLREGSVPLPEHEKYFKWELQKRFVAENRHLIAPTWPSNAVSHINEVLHTLPSVLEVALRCLFGLNDASEPMKPEAVAQEMGTTIEVVEANKAKGLAALRSPDKAMELAPLIVPIGTSVADKRKAWNYALALVAKEEAVEEFILHQKSLNPDFDSGNLEYWVDELFLSSQTVNALKDGGYLKTRDVVIKTPVELRSAAHITEAVLEELARQLSAYSIIWPLP